MNIDQIKKDYFTFSNNSDIEKTHLWQVFLRIFSLLICSFLPLIIAVFLIFKSNVDDNIKNRSIEAIGYTLNIVFIIIYYTIVFIAQICYKLKRTINKSTDRKQRNMKINSGLYSLFLITIMLLVIFIVISIVYSQVRAYKFQDVSKYIIHYMLLMVPIIIFNSIANFFINLSFSIDGIKSNWIQVSLCLLCVIEIMMIFLFEKYVNLSNLILLLIIPSLIIGFIKMVVFTSLFYIRDNYFTQLKKDNEDGTKYHIFSFSKSTFKKIMKRCSMSIYFSISLMVTIIVQSIFIGFAYKIDPNLGYLITGDANDGSGCYTLLFVKIIVYGLLYLIFSISRAFNISMLEQEDYRKKNFDTKIKRKIYLRKVNVLMISALTFVSIVVYLMLNQIIDLLFNNINWYNDKINEGDGTFFINHTYKEIIPVLTKQSFLYGIIAFFLVEHSINNRIIIFRTDKANMKLFILIIISYALSMSLLTYVFGFLCNKILIGLSGFLLSFASYGLFALIIIIIFELKRCYKFYGENIPNEVTNMTRFKFIKNKWRIDKNYRTNVKFDLYYYISMYLINIGMFVWVFYELISISLKISCSLV